jgi:nucleotide-binding universal stress UspA family protein
VRVLSVVPPIALLTPEMAFYTGESLDRGEQKATQNAKEFIARMGDWLQASGLELETTVRSGEPRTVILEEAQGWDADLIVIGSHGHTGVKRWLLGSVAQSVVCRAGCSVEVVRPKQTHQVGLERDRTDNSFSHAVGTH